MSGTHGLYIMDGFYKGKTGKCETFFNDVLTGGKEDFFVDSVELWGFDI